MTDMTEHEFIALRDYYIAKGTCLDKGEKPPPSLIRKGWLRHVIDDFHEITPSGELAFESARRGLGLEEDD